MINYKILNFSNQMLRVNCLGDSLTQFGVRQNGWIALLQQHFERKIQFSCNGYSGYNTTWILRYFDSIYPLNTDYDVYLVWLGTNDCCETTNQFVSLKDFESNYRQLVTTIKTKHPQSTIVLISPMPTTRLERKSFHLYNNTLKTIKDTTLLNLLNCEWSSTDYIDDLHLSDQGNKKIFEIVSRYLVTFTPKVHLPDWKTLS